MKGFCRALICLAGCGFQLSRAAEGPGIPNVAYSSSRVGEILSITDPGKAISAIAMHRGYLFIPLGADHGGGNGDGAFAFYNVANPSAPVKVMDSRDYPAVYHNNSGTAALNYVGDWAELHHMPICGDLLMVSERHGNSAGISIFDMAPMYDDSPSTRPRTISRYLFPGVTGPTNYDGYSFALGWQGNRYVYAPTGANGLFVVDTTNLEAPTLLAHRTRSALGNVTLRAAVPIGNLLILYTAAEEAMFEARIFDISDPANPVQIGDFRGPQGYQGFVYGGAFYGGGAPIMRHDFSDPRNVVNTTLYANPVFTKPEYGFGKDGDLFIGHYPGATKWRLNGNRVDYISRVDSGLVDDHAFLNPLGNLVALCTDHNNNRKMMIGIHGAEQDVSPPQPLFVSPGNGETNVSVKSRVGICFSDFVRADSLTGETLAVREYGSTVALAGSYSVMQGIVNFVPAAELRPGTSYEVVLKAGGVKDQAGNAPAAEVLVSRFSTGTAINPYVVQGVLPVAKQTGQAAELAITITRDPGNLEHSWNFGDGTPETAYAPATSVSHTYAGPGNFNVNVKTRVAGTTAATSVNVTQVVHLPIPATPPQQSTTLAVDPAQPLVWNVNADNDSVTAIHATTYARVYEIPVGANPRSLAFGPSNTLWVVNKKAATLSVIDRATGMVKATHPLPGGSAPHALLISGGKGYVSLEALGVVARVDLATGGIEATVATGPWPRGLALDPARDRLWVARFISPEDAGRVTPVALSSFTALPAVSLAMVHEEDSLINGRGLPNYLGALAVSPDLSQMYVPAKKDNILRGGQRDGEVLTFEHTVRSMAANIDLATGQENPALRLDFDNNDFATAVAFSPLGNFAFFATSGSRTIWVADAYRKTGSFAFDSGGIAPDGLAFSADGTRLYVHHFMDRSITVFNAGIACASICGAAPQLAKVATVSTERLTPEVLRGKQLFYSSADPRLAQEGYMSCASCHLDGGHDGRVWDFTSLGEGLRNTIDLNGRGVGHGPLHWSGNFDEGQDFEGQIRELASGSGLLADADFHHGSRSQPLGEPKAGLGADLDALDAYLRSLRTVGRSPRRLADGSLSAEAAAGRVIFQQQNCAACHGGTAFSDSASLARHDVGTLTAASGQRLGGELTGLDTPTLRGLWQGAPYLHDGSAATLREVFTTRDLSGKHAGLFGLGEAEIGQLVAYLESIDDLETAAPAAAGVITPVIAAASAQTTMQYREVSLALSASPASGLKWQALSLPPGMMIDPDTGAIRGTAAEPGSFTARVGVRHSSGGYAEISFGWRVTEYQPGLGSYRYVKLMATSALNGQPFSAIAEFNLQDENGETISRTGWTVRANTQETVGENGAAALAIDGDPTTYWHSEWYNGADVGLPHEWIVDLGSRRGITAFRYLPRQNHDNGRIGNWRFYWSNDGVTWGNPVAQGTFTAGMEEQTVGVSPGTGSLTREYWSNLPGTTVAALTGAPAYPGSPSGTTFPATFAAPVNFGDNYGTRIHGFLVPPVTGEYTFWIAADDQSELWLSPNVSTSAAVKIAGTDDWTDSLQWTKFASQKSAPVMLRAGFRYYIRALHKESVGGDHLAVSWQRPGMAQQVIPGSALIRFSSLAVNDPPVLAANTPTVLPVEESRPAGTLLATFAATDANAGDVLTWAITSGNGAGLFALNPATGALSLAASPDYETASLHRLQITVKDSATPSAATSVEVLVPVINVAESNGERVRLALSAGSGAFAGHGNPALIGFDADPDGDGVPNAIEILLGTDPGKADRAAPVRFGTAFDGGKTYMVYEFDVASGSGLDFRCAASSELAVWERLLGQVQLISDSGGKRTYRIRDDVAIEDSPNRFMRLSVEE